MATQALNNIIDKVPNWQIRLDELSSQIDRRQTELAAIAAQDPKAAEVQSLRNKGSTESLKPKDDGPSNIADPGPLQASPIEQNNISEEPLGAQQDASRQQAAQSPDHEAVGRTTFQRQDREVAVAAHSRARAQLKKRQRSSSTASGENIGYRTRSMIIVYYDSYVQGFFDELVRFISSSRNLMRKAKMAAKVAQIKRMAEMESANDEDAHREDNSNGDGLPSIRYMTAPRFGSRAAMGRAGPGLPGGADQPKDVYDNLDAGLEQIQSTCEHGAHQFLRDANCNEEIKNIRNIMTTVLKMAKAESNRVQLEEPELAKETNDMGKARTRRPISMRKDMYATKEQSQTSNDYSTKLEVAEAKRPGTTIIQAADSLEVDNTSDDGVELSLESLLPKMQYRSTRAMRHRIGS